MVLQRLEGLSDREAVDRFSFDARAYLSGSVAMIEDAEPGDFMPSLDALEAPVASLSVAAPTSSQPSPSPPSDAG